TVLMPPAVEEVSDATDSSNAVISAALFSTAATPGSDNHKTTLVVAGDGLLWEPSPASLSGPGTAPHPSQSVDTLSSDDLSSHVHKVSLSEIDDASGLLDQPATSEGATPLRAPKEVAMVSLLAEGDLQQTPSDINHMPCLPGTDTHPHTSTVDVIGESGRLSLRQCESPADCPLIEPSMLGTNDPRGDCFPGDDSKGASIDLSSGGALIRVAPRSSEDAESDAAGLGPESYDAERESDPVGETEVSHGVHNGCSISSAEEHPNPIADHNLGSGSTTAACLTVDMAIEDLVDELTLDHNSIGDKGAAALAEALSSLTQLTGLALDHNSIGDNGATSLSEALSYLTALTVQLKLDHNSFGDAGASALGKALPYLTGLTGLSLDHNSIGDKGVAALAEALPSLTQLTQ
ncbi:hypothetical protein KIPB_010949, partial [Kipferlia bialata]